VFRLRVLENVAENQLALAPGVAGVHEAIDVVALDQPQQHPQPRLALGDRLKVEMRGDVRQLVEGPFAALDVLIGRHDDR
jgi:hypothetical protein